MADETRSEILRTIPYGFYITGVLGEDGEPNGFTTCWVSQVSFEPQRIIISVHREQRTHGLLEATGVFTLNFLDNTQEEIARTFTRTVEPGDGTVGGYAYTSGDATGAPVFDDAFAHLECRVAGSMEAGDHTVFLGEVVSANLRRPADLLTDLDTPMDYGG